MKNKTYSYNHGEAARFIFGEDCSDIGKALKELFPKADFIEKGQKAPLKKTYTYKEKKSFFEIPFICADIKGECNFISSYPVLNSNVKIKAKLLELHVWNEIKAEANATFILPWGAKLEAFLPYFWKDGDIDTNLWYEIALSSFMLIVDPKGTLKDMEIRKGFLWEEHKSKYLKDHPKVKEEEIPSYILKAEFFSALNPIENDADWYSYVGKISNPRYFKQRGKSYCLFHVETYYYGEEFELETCVNLDNCDLKFKEGDHVSGVFWMHASNFKKLDVRTSKKLELSLKNSLSED